MDPPTAEFYTLSLHDALPIFLDGDRSDLRKVLGRVRPQGDADHRGVPLPDRLVAVRGVPKHERAGQERSEEHTSELQSRRDLVCRLLLEKKNINKYNCVL